MKFNLDSNKQAQEVYFSNRTNKDSSPSITFHNSKSWDYFMVETFRVYPWWTAEFQQTFRKQNK